MKGAKGLALFSLLVAVFGEPKSFEGHEVFSVLPKDKSEVDFLDRLLKSEANFDFWTYPFTPGQSVDIHVDPVANKQLQKLLNEAGISFQKSGRDIQKAVDEEKASARTAGYDEAYHRLHEINKELIKLVSIHSDVARSFSLGKSYENRDQLAIEIKKNNGGKKDLFFFNCGIHAREWISPSTCMYIIRQMLEKRNTDKDIQYMLDNFEWVILPVFNVDGYEYTHTHDRMWRKTRSYPDGADPNRNFNYRFAGVGTSSDPNSDLFTGDRPFSEKVSYNVAKYLYGRRRELKAYIDFHAYSQLWMSPWGYTSAYPPHYDEQKKAMKAAVDALTAVHGTPYKYGPAAITIYPTTGDTTDWTFGVLGVIHSYCVELRPKSYSDGGFILPPDKIIPVGEETFAGLKALTKHVK